MNRTPPPIPKSYQRHKLERASLVEPEMERSTEIPKSSSNNSLPNISVSTTASNDPPVANLLSFSPPPTPPPRRRKQRGAQKPVPVSVTLDIPDQSTALIDQSSSDELDSSTSSSSSNVNSPVVAPPLPPRVEMDNYIAMLQQPKNTKLPPPADLPPPLPPRDDLIPSPVLMYNSGTAPPLPSRDDPMVPIIPPRDRKKLSPNSSRKITYTPPLPHKDYDLGPRRNSIECLCNSPSPDVPLLDMENQWQCEDFGNSLARQLLAQDSRTSFTEEIAKKLQSNLFMRPSKAVMDTLSHDDSSSLPPPLIPSTTSSHQVDAKTDDCPPTAKSSNPLDQLLDKNDLSKWMSSSNNSSNSSQRQEKHATPNGNVLT